MNAPIQPPRSVGGLAVDGSAVDALLDAGRELALKALPSPLGCEGVPYVILRDADGNERVEYVREAFQAPKRMKGAVRMDDAESFIAYFNRFAAAQSLIYGATAPTLGFVGVLNEHIPPSAGIGAPDYRDLRALFTPKLSPEWQAWTGRNGREKGFKGNVEFAEWLEDQIPDVVKPAGSTLLQIALTFKVQEGVLYKHIARLADGNVDLDYQRTVDAGATTGAGGKVKIPEDFTIKVPVFAGINAPKYDVQARFRFRLNGGALSIWYELIRPHKVIEQAFVDLLDLIQRQCKRKVLFGAPDA
jgi:uncharacterized protein YfdQ (DUF2303 family)